MYLTSAGSFSHEREHFLCMPKRLIRGLLLAVVFLTGVAPGVRAQEGGSTDYAISVGDALQLDFLDDEAGPYVIAVGGDGAVQLPFLGTVDVLGMPLWQAGETIAALYVEGDILIAPRIDLSVLNLRPFSVLGDVVAPGFFDYRPDISVEQAVGLAGGPVREAVGEETRSLQRISLRAELAVIEGAMLREAVAAARLDTQLEDATKIPLDAVQVGEIANPDQRLITTLVAQDEEIIAAERAHFRAERTLIEQAIAEVELQIVLTEEQIVSQATQIGSYDAELQSNADLTDRGLVAAPVRAGLLRRVADEETALLRLQTNLAATRRDRTGLRRELLGLDYRRIQGWRLELAEVGLRAAQHRASRLSALDRLALVENWSRRSMASDNEVRLSYVVRRRTPEGRQVTMAMAQTDALWPGDVLIVRLIEYTSKDEASLVDEQVPG